MKKAKGIPASEHSRAKQNLMKAIKLLQGVVAHEKKGLMKMKKKK